LQLAIQLFFHSGIIDHGVTCGGTCELHGEGGHEEGVAEASNPYKQALDSGVGMKRVGQQHAHHGVLVACKNDPVLEGSALPDNPVCKQLQLVQALRRSIGRLLDEVAVVVDAVPVLFDLLHSGLYNGA